jgi:CRISPR system Cascade subunit CasD
MQPDGRLGGTVLSWRSYLADASFLVGLEGDEGLLREVDAALAAPRWQFFLGRKAFLPGEPVRLPDAPPHGPGLRPEPREEALRAYPWVARRQGDRPLDRLRLVLEPDTTEGLDVRGADVRADVPVSFAARTFATRAVRMELAPAPPVVSFEDALASAGGVA